MVLSPRCLLLAVLLLLPVNGALAQGTDLLADPVATAPVIIEVGSGVDLQAVIDVAPDGAILRLEAGDYTAHPTPYQDPLCGNCQDHATPVTASTGFVIRGKSLSLVGPSEGLATLHTRAGYGLFIEDAPEVTLSQLAIVDGIRDRDGRATDGAVVVRHSQVTIEACTLGPNPVPKKVLDDTIVGICGVVGREGARILVRDSLISGNSWDGVACYRGAEASLWDTQIDTGRGVGVGITWDSQVTATRVQVTGYWKGIGTFGTSTATVRNCLIHAVRGWGLIASGQSQLTATNCTVVRCGNVGIARWNPEATLRLTNSISWGNGTEREWVAPRVGLWWMGSADAPEVRHCLFGNNAEGNFQLGSGVSIDRDWSLAGQSGNRVGHPLYRTPGDWRAVHGASPVIDGGDPTIRDRDGSVSDLGWTGGPEGTTG